LRQPDGRSDLLPVAGTVSREESGQNLALDEGKNPDGSYVMHAPGAVTMERLQRGRERYNIYCGPCHDRAGSGKGLIVTKPNPTFPPPPSFHDDRIRRMPDGEIFNTISNGIRTMPSYRHQVPVEDRWAIIAYLRALERSQQASLQDLRPDELERLKQ
jgi:mono/diheme cytochrome c family protein